MFKLTHKIKSRLDKVSWGGEKTYKQITKHKMFITVNFCFHLVKAFSEGDTSMNSNPNAQKSYKSYKNYLQNTEHVVLRNRPTLSITTERLTCLNKSPGVQLGTLA